MFFDEEELKVAEDLAWKVLDGRNHAYMPNLKDYAHFYYKGQIIFDPWMNEKSQRAKNQLLIRLNIMDRIQ